MICLGVLALGAGADELHPANSANDFQQITGDDPDGETSRRENPKPSAALSENQPAALLKRNAKFLPEKKNAIALDIAMGSGQNAVFLASLGFRVEGVEPKAAAIVKAKQLARQKGVKIRAIQADAESFGFKADTYDVVLSFDFLDRKLVSKLKKSLRKGGVVFFENATLEQLNNEHQKDLRRDLLLAPGELKEMFKDLQILYYREENDGKSAKARLIARRTS